MKRLITASNDVGTGLTTKAVVFGSLSIPALTSGWDCLKGAALPNMTVLLPMRIAPF